jgi:transcriptional regulator with PAS, ATPase and Fis domain
VLVNKKTETKASIDLESFVNSHERPFVIIDKDYSILAANQAYRELHGIDNRDIVGDKCYAVSHGNDRPCGEEGEECPHESIFKTGEAKVVAHIHCDAVHNLHQVKVSAYPLKGLGDELFLGECIEEIASIKNLRSGNKQMVGQSQPFVACTNQLKVAASSDAPVLLQGETGTGKELAAEFVHNHSSRSKKAFQIVDSTVLTENLFESELFGHVAGAYTGSVGSKQGLFELAEGGTIFLDEIGDMPLSQQAKLLRVLESGQYRPVGGKRLRKADVRIICATNRHLWESVLAGKFREDLYYRIACLNIRLPSLRERLDDIPVLAQNLLDGINRSMHSSYHLTSDVFDRLKSYHYPGNVRELRNVLFIATTQSHNREINAEIIESVMSNMPHCNKSSTEVADGSVSRQDEKQEVETTGSSVNKSVTLKSMEEKHIRELLEQYSGNRKQVADALGISERTIYRKLKRLGIH